MAYKMILPTKPQRFVPACIPKETTTNVRNSRAEEDFMQHEFIMYFTVPVEFSMSAQSPQAI